MVDPASFLGENSDDPEMARKIEAGLREIHRLDRILKEKFKVTGVVPPLFVLCNCDAG